MNTLVEAAKVEHELAAKRLLQTLKTEYPIGSHCTIKLKGRPIAVEVISHNEFWWSSLGQMTGVNLQTGKTRRFHYSSIESA